MPELDRPEVWSWEEQLAQARTACDMAKAAGTDDAVASVSRRRGVSFVWRDDRIEKVQEDASRSLVIELYVDGRYSTHVTHDFDRARLAAFLMDAVALTRHLEPDPHRSIPDPRLYEGRSDVDLDLVDPDLTSLDREERMAICRTLAEAAREDPSVISATSRVQDTYGTLAQASTNGFSGAEASTVLFQGATVTIRDGESKRPEASHSVAGTHRADLPAVASVGTEALRRALDARGAAKTGSTRTAMVLHPETAAAFVARMLGAMSAGQVQQGRSFLAEKRGGKIASDLLTIRDEPLLPRALGSRTFDDEGIAAHARAMVEDGVLEAFYVDTYYGKKLGWEPTTGSPSNLVFRHGDRDLDGILRDLDDGILVTSWLGGNANMTSGDFSFGVRGHRIRSGARAEPVSEMNVTGNYLDLMHRLVTVGNDPVPWYACRTPTLVFDGVQFSGA